MLVDLPEDVDSVMYAGSGSTAEEVGVFTAKDSNQAKETMEDVQKYLDDQADSFQDYVPGRDKTWMEMRCWSRKISMWFCVCPGIRIRQKKL